MSLETHPNPRFGLLAKLDSLRSLELAATVIETLGAEVVLEPATAKALAWSGPSVPLEGMEVEAVITIGGDGTLLRTLCSAPAPLFTVNGGEVGFLTEVAAEELLPALEKLKARDYQIERVQRLAPRLNDRALEPAANEVVLHTAQLAKMLHVEVVVGGEAAEEIRADGLIVATPTGSTSYAMSAGGPLLHPRVEGVVIVPIAPFKLSARPLVAPADTTIEVRLLADKPAELVIDGHARYDFSSNDVLLLERAAKPGKLIRFTAAYYHRLRSKLTN